MKKLIIWILVLATVLSGCVFNPADVRQSHNETAAQEVPDEAQTEAQPEGQEPPAQPTADSEPLPHEQDWEEENQEAPAQTPAPAQPQPQTPAATQPAQQTVTDPMATASDRYKINIFLSNFSEIGFHLGYLWPTDPSATFYSSSGDIMEMVSFAWLNGKINENACEIVDIGGDYYYGVDIGTIDYLVNRYFGRRVTELDIRSLDQYGSHFYVLYEGQVCCPAADGDTYNGLTVADSMTSLGDGTYRVDFHIYSAEITGDDSLVSIGGTIVDKSLYELTAAQAQSHWGLTVEGSGTAVVRPFTTVNGTPTYQLVSYTVY